MTTMALHQPRKLSPIVFVLVLAALAIPAVRECAHASLHAEADQVRQCYDQGNVFQVWINSSGERLNCLVDMGDGKVGDRVIQWCKRSGWIEVTSYVLGDSSLTETIRILREKMCTLVYSR